jgi:cytochrome c biogenesis protein CcmG, thiol:disulfide interchange protein DsbE
LCGRGAARQEVGQTDKNAQRKHQAMRMPASRIGKTVPVLMFVVFAGFVWRGLNNDPRMIPPVLVGKPVPDFNLPALPDLNVQSLASSDLKKGKVTLVNIWASWCIPCRSEQPLLLELAGRKDIQVVGINNKDQAENARNFLVTMGNPFSAIGVDRSGRTTMDFGTYGVPETFLVDGRGIIRFKIIGGITAQNLNVDLPREIAKAQMPLN